MNLLERVKELCSEKGISQRKLESELELSNGSTSKWGKSSPSADILQKVAEYFDVSTDYLLGKVPFKNETEAYYSISIASVKYLLSHNDEIPSYYNIYSGMEYSLDKDINENIRTYSYSLLNKFDKKLELTNLELFELSNIIFSEIKWTKDFDGVVYLKNYNEESISIKLNFDKIDKFNENTLNIESSIILKSNNLDDNFFLKHNSIFNFNSIKSMPKQKSVTNSTPTTIAAHLPDGVELTEEEQQQIDDYIQFILSRRKK